MPEDSSLIEIPALPPELEAQKNEFLSGSRTYMMQLLGLVGTLASAGGFRVSEQLPAQIALWGDSIQYGGLAVFFALGAYYKAKSTSIGILAIKKAEKLKIKKFIGEVTKKK